MAELRRGLLGVPRPEIILTGYSVRFRGGPLGGETRVIEHPMWRMVVPSLRQFRVTEWGPEPTNPVRHDYEEYELGPASGPECAYEYIWINPADGLRDHVRELTADLTKTSEYCRRETERADDLVEDADRWRSFKRLIHDLSGDAS